MASPYALDFSPVANALEQNRRHGLALQQQEMARNRLSMEQERLGFERELQPFKVAQFKRQGEAADLEYESALAKRFAGLAQAMDAEADEAKRADMLKKVYAADPRIQATLGKHMPAELLNDPVAVSRYWTALARGYQDPLDRRAKEAGIGKSEADALESRAKAGLADAQAAQGKFLPLGENTQGVFDVTKREVIPVGVGDANQRLADKEAAKARGEAQGKAQASWPVVKAATDRLLNQIDRVLYEPDPANPDQFLPDPAASGQPLPNQNLPGITGPFAGHPYRPSITKSGAQIALEERIKQIGGATFLQAFEALKGGGAIQEREGEKATAALARVLNLQQGTAEYREALLDLRREMEELQKLAFARTSGQLPAAPRDTPQPQVAPPRATAPQPNARRPPPADGEVRTGRDGIPRRFLGGGRNPADPNSWEVVR